MEWRQYLYSCKDITTIQSTVWLPHAGHIINIHELTPIDAASQTSPACGCKSQSGAQARITLEILGIISHDL